MSDDLIANQGPKVLAQITISLVEVAPGKTGTRVDHSCPDELMCLGLLEKGRQIIALMFAQANAPRVLPVNGGSIIPDTIKRHFRG